MPTKARILLVDSSQESREILRTLLDRQGTEILETAKFQAAAELAARQSADLIVCDTDCDRSPRHAASQELARQASRNAIPIVALGTPRANTPYLSGGDRVSKPYHYAPLIRKIEQLLEPIANS